MTSVEFRTAAKKGQGRALLALRDRSVLPSLSEFRRLVLRWHGYDAQCESSRGWYTVELILASKFETELTTLLILLLARRKGSWRNHSHRVAVVLELALRGNTDARNALYSNFSAENDFHLASEIVSLDGEEGLKWVLAHPMKNEQAWLLSMFESELGEERFRSWTHNNPRIQEFRRINHAPPMNEETPVATFDELRRRRGNQSARTWFKTASLSEQQLAWESFTSEDDPYWLRRLANALKREPTPEWIPLVIERARRWTGDRNPFLIVLGESADVRVRSFALELIESGIVAEGLELMRLNAMPGDEGLLLANAKLLEDPFEIHLGVMSLLGLSPHLKRTEILLWCAETSPCSFCRSNAIEKLVATGEAPTELLEEALLDCVDETRLVAARGLQELY